MTWVNLELVWCADLFNNDMSVNSSELLSPQNDDDQEDDLEIPAFLEDKKLMVFKINGYHHCIGWFKTYPVLLKNY